MHYEKIPQKITRVFVKIAQLYVSSKSPTLLGCLAHLLGKTTGGQVVQNVGGGEPPQKPSRNMSEKIKLSEEMSFSR